ncbi:membrane protein [Vibrio cholerae O1 biovar El Tor str. L-3226]|nr:membrane protein [Vibrio cholerae O1 biovar El Tor str. L-3226]KEA47270.1 membrane protein [Vibrio cholerae O1 biovar El Tor]
MCFLFSFCSLFVTQMVLLMLIKRDFKVKNNILMQSCSY